MQTGNRGSDMIRTIIMTALMMALTTVATMIIQIPIPFTNGYIHLGDSMVFLSVLVLGWKYGAIAAGMGSCLADLFVGYIHWVPWTFGIKFLMAVLMGLVIEKCRSNRKNAVWASLAAVVLWLAFNAGIQWIIRSTAKTSPESLLGDEVASLSELGTFLNSVQSKLMLAALLIPLFLVLISIYIRKREQMVIPVYQILGMTMAGLWMVFGYYVAGGVMYGNFAVAAFSIPMNMIQFVIGFLLASLLAAALGKTPAASYFAYHPRMLKR